MNTDGKAEGQMERDMMTIIRYVNGEAEKEEAILAYYNIGLLLGFNADKEGKTLGRKEALCG